MTATTAQASASTHRSSVAPKVEKYRPLIGANVSSIDLDQPLDDAAKSALRAAFLEHGVLFFRDQKFGPQRLVEVAKLFGRPYKQNEYNHGLEGFPDIEVLENSENKQAKADVWHADVTWQPNPPKATILQAQDLPASGGDTVWATTAGAYDLLDPKLAAYLETLTAVNSLELTRLPEYLQGTYGGRYPEEGGAQRLAAARALHPPLEVPVIATHPETGRKVINVNEGHTSHIKHVSRALGHSLLTLLFDLIKTPELQARFEWQPGSVAVWDNRQVNHYGVNDYGSGFRKFHRITIRDAAAS